MSRSLPGGRTTQSPGAAAAVAAATAYRDAAPGTAVTLPSYTTPQRAAYITGTAAPAPAPGPTVIKPTSKPAPRPAASPAPVYDDPDTGADGANPYLSLLGPGAGTLTDNAGSSANHDDGPRDIPWLIGGVLLALGLLGWLLWRR